MNAQMISKLVVAFALLAPSVALAADEPKPSVCIDFRVYQAEGKPLGVCYDGKKPALFSSWRFVDMANPSGATRRYAVGFR